MAAQRGQDLLLKLRLGAGPFTTVGGLRARRLVFDAELVDVTHAESAGRWRELLGAAGVRRASLAGSGIFRDAASDLMLRQAFFDGAVPEWQIVLPDFGIVEGAFQIARLDYRGEHNGAVQFELALESAGPLAFSPL